MKSPYTSLFEPTIHNNELFKAFCFNATCVYLLIYTYMHYPAKGEHVANIDPITIATGLLAYYRLFPATNYIDFCT